MQIIILAGGLGTRLWPMTQETPKALIPILGKPFIDYQLHWLRQFEIKKVILSTGYLGNKIQDFVEDGAKWGLGVQYVDEGKNLRGTGGALRLIYEKNLLEESFLVTYGDSFLPIDFKAVWDHFQKRAEPALMTVLNNEGKWDTSNACYNGNKITLYDKAPVSKPSEMQYIDYGLSGFRRTLIENGIPAGEKSDLSVLFHQLSLRGDLAGYPVSERFYEIGSKQGILDLEEYLKKQNRAF